MSRLANPENTALREMSELNALRARRDRLLRKARYRLHRNPDLLAELQQTTNEILKRELQTQNSKTAGVVRLGDVEPSSRNTCRRLPYKD